MENVKPVDFFQSAPVVERKFSDLNNKIIGRQRGLSLSLDGKSFTVSFTQAPLSMPSIAAWAVVRFRGAEARILVTELEWLPALKAIIGEAPVREGLPPELFAAALALILTPLLEAIPDLRLESAALGAPEGPMSDGTVWRFGMEIFEDGGNIRGGGVLECTPSGAERLAEALQPLDGAGGWGIAPDAVGRIQLRSILVAQEEFEGLAPQDILVLGAYGMGGPAPIRLFFAPGLYFIGTLDGGVLRMQREPDKGVAAEEQGNQDTVPAAVDKLPVRIGFELGTVTVSMAELRDLSAGAVIELSAPVEAPVILRANGREIGKGALLRIEDHVGVRILELYKG